VLVELINSSREKVKRWFISYALIIPMVTQLEARNAIQVLVNQETLMLTTTATPTATITSKQQARTRVFVRIEVTRFVSKPMRMF